MDFCYADERLVVFFSFQKQSGQYRNGLKVFHKCHVLQDQMQPLMLFSL